MKLVRTFLFAPGNRPRMVAKVGSTGTDNVILDLEDAVAISEKEATRPIVRQAIDDITASTGTPVYVRINPIGVKTAFSQDFGMDDLQAVVCPNLAGIILPKVESAEEVRHVDRVLSELEQARGVPNRQIEVMPILETAVGLLNAREIAGACKERVPRMCIGAGDLTFDLGIEWTRGEEEIFFGRSWIVLCSRAAGIEPPMDTVYADIADAEGLARSTRLAKQLGFQGKMCIHPSQVAVVNEVFSPSEEQVAYAKRVVDAFDQATAEGKGSVMFEGKLLDYPIVEKEKRLLARAAAIAARGR